MYPQSQMDKTQYAVSSQMPTSAAVMKADYDPLTDPLTGTITEAFASGGIASIPRYDGEEGSQVEAPVEEKRPPTMAELAAQLKEEYNTNADYEPTWKQFQSLKETNPAEWHKHQLGFLGHQQGWQIGQNTSERNAAGIPVIQDEIEQARKAGVSDQEIQQILAGSEQSANYQNQQRIAQEGAAAKGGGVSGLIVPAATIGAMIAAPYLAPMLGGGLGGAMAAGALTGGTLGGLNAGMSGGNVGQGILKGGAMGGATAGVTSGLGGLDPSIAQGIKGVNTARSIYNAAQNPNNPMAAYGAAKNAYSFANSPMFAAKGGLMAGGGVADLGSYSDGGRLLKGPGDGMSDHIPATIGAKQPARLAEGEFVVPADVVSHLGNGSTDAGAKQLYKMMDNIRKARTGNPKQGKQINPDKFTPKG
jgi:hypothetical protein